MSVKRYVAWLNVGYEKSIFTEVVKSGEYDKLNSRLETLQKECESLRKENERLLGFLNKVKKELHGDNDDYFICLNIDVLLGELFGDVQPLPPPPHKGGCE